MAWIQNKRVVITGATSGIGREVAIRLASQGAHVILACRDRWRADEVAAEINAGSASKRAAVMSLDTSDQGSIRAFGRDYRRTYGSLDVLVNNAGVLLPDWKTSVDGIELTFATNVLGFYLVTTEMLDALRAGAPSRVVNVASTFASDLEMADLQFERRPYDGLAAYAQSKACDRMLTWALARRLRAASITVNAMAPGLVLGTNLYRHLTVQAKRSLEQYGSRSVAEGAEAALWLASSTELDGVSGRFYDQGTEISCQFRDEETEEALWRTCQQLVEEREPGPAASAGAQ